MLKIIKILFNYILILLGFLLVFFFIYFAFFRLRLPKLIPFNLTEYPKPINSVAYKILF